MVGIYEEMSLIDRIFGEKYECVQFNGPDGYRKYKNSKGQIIKIEFTFLERYNNNNVSMQSIRIKTLK